MASQYETKSILVGTDYIILATPNKLVCKKFVSASKEYALIEFKDLAVQLDVDVQYNEYIEWVSNRSSRQFDHMYYKYKVRACYNGRSKGEINKVVIPWVGESIRGNVLIYSAHYADQENDEEYEYGVETNQALTLKEAKKVFKKLKHEWVEPTIIVYSCELME